MLIWSCAAAAGQIEDEVNSLFSPWDGDESPGAVVAVLLDGKIVHEGAFGAANLELGVPLTTKTLLNAGSIAKHMTATAALMLEAEGKLSLDDEVGEYMPALPDYSVPITLRHLLHHTSGLRDVWALTHFDNSRIGFLIL